MQHQLQTTELTTDDLNEVLRRAADIDSAGIRPGDQPTDLDSFVRAAQDVGITREAITQALAERAGTATIPVAVGDRVFAKSADDAFYVATVSSLSDGVVQVRFISGSDHSLPAVDVKPFRILPGQKLQVNWPTWGWYDVDVEVYDAASEKVTASDGLKSKSFPLHEVRLPQQKTERQQRVSQLILQTALVAGGLGGILGAFLMRLLS